MLQSQVDLVEASFFDDQIERITDNNIMKKQNLWITETQFDNYLKEQGYQKQSQILLEDYFQTQDSLTKKINQYYFVLYADRLVAYSNSEKEEELGIILIQRAKLQYYQSDIKPMQSIEHLTIPYFVLSRNTYFDILMTDNEEQFNKWLAHLKRICILSHYNYYYENCPQIGQGTFAKVVLSRCKSDGKEYATKVFKKKELYEAVQFEKVLTSLQNEILVMKQINHPNMLNVHEVYEGASHIYVVMELASIDLFNQITEKRDQITETTCQNYTKQILEALEYLHSKNIAHRDIKPENILLKTIDSNELLLADFGLSEYLTKSKLLFEKCGTPGYIAPEVLKNLKYSTKVDIFSLGIILFNLITGKAAFTANSYQELYAENMDCKIDMNQLQNASVSQQCLDLLAKMLEPEPSQRISASEALQHPWITKKVISTKSVTKQFNFKLNISKPNNLSGSKNIIMNSPQKRISVAKNVKPSPIGSPVPKGRKRDINFQKPSYFSQFSKEK